MKVFKTKVILDKNFTFNTKLYLNNNKNGNYYAKISLDKLDIVRLIYKERLINNVINGEYNKFLGRTSYKS